MPYPALPAGVRMAYDRDGSVGFATELAGPPTTLSNATLLLMNDEDSDFWQVSHSYSGLVFPELRDLTGVYFLNSNQGGGGNGVFSQFQTSVDTTTGLDGTWDNLGNPGVGGHYRSGINALALTGIKGIRAYFTTGGSGIRQGIHNWHIYGSISAGQTLDKLVLWHPTLDQPLEAADLNWEDVARGSLDVREFRVKNISATLTASTITASLESLSESAAPTNLSMHALSDDGVTYSTTATITALTPGEISAVKYLRRNYSVTANVGPWVVRVPVVAVSWT